MIDASTGVAFWWTLPILIRGHLSIVELQDGADRAFAFQKHDTPELVADLQHYSATLSEKDRRRFAAVEARRLGHGGIHYVASILGCSRRTIERSLAELEDLPNDPAVGRVRRSGGGRKNRSTRTRNSKRT